jgi:hypothetical protein
MESKYGGLALGEMQRLKQLTLRRAREHAGDFRVVRCS